MFTAMSKDGWSGMRTCRLAAGSPRNAVPLTSDSWPMNEAGPGEPANGTYFFWKSVSAVPSLGDDNPHGSPAGAKKNEPSETFCFWLPTITVASPFMT